MTINDPMIEITTADITTLSVDIIVNAANSSLLGGCGVDGAIHRAAGPELLAECRILGGAATGEVKLTKAYALPARYVAHAVGPRWHGGDRGEAADLASCYRRSLTLLVQNGLKSIAFPAISTGIYGYPLKEATRIALNTTMNYIGQQDPDLQIVFCYFSESDRKVYELVAVDLGITYQSR